MAGVFAVLGNVGSCNYYFNSAIIEIIKAAKALMFDIIIGIQNLKDFCLSKNNSALPSSVIL